MSKIFKRVSDGMIVPESEATTNGVIRDGYATYQRAILMDGFRSGTIDLEDARVALRDKYDERVSTAWRTPAAPPPLRDQSQTQDRSVSQAAYDARVASAWRG
jgi:hypothetical protein